MEKTNINPWLHLWIHPKKTLRSILDTNPRRVIIWLAIIGGMVSSFSLRYLKFPYPPNEATPNVFLIIALLIIGGLIGLLYLYFGGWIFTLTGSWIGGKGNYTDVKCAVGWNNYPFIIANIFSILSLASFPHVWLETIFGFLNAVGAIWGFIIFMNLLGEAHRFSAWKGLLAFIIAFVLIFVAIMIIALIIPLLTPLFQ